MSEMKYDELLAWMNRAQNDTWYKSQLPINHKTVAHIVGYKNSGNMKKFLTGEWAIIPVIADRWRRAIVRIENRHIIWDKEQFMNLDPPEKPPKIHRLSPEEKWSPFVACVSCGGNKWLPVLMDVKPCVVCYTCLPPSQFESLGALWTYRNLFSGFIKEEICRQNTARTLATPTPALSVVYEPITKTSPTN
jgi:hypothetical protein